MKIYTLSEMKRAEEETFRRGIEPLRLMENAGAAFSKTVRDNIETAGRKIAVVVGDGNNGGDGYVAARKFREYGSDVTVIRAFGGRMTESCAYTAQKVADAGIKTVSYTADREYCLNVMQESDIVIDAIFGIGFHGEPDTYSASIFEDINKSGAFVVALDIPSGITADANEVPTVSVNADMTVSLAAYKYCHILPKTSERCGKVLCCAIGIPDSITDSIGNVETIDFSDIKELFPKRKKNSHKGTYGTASFLCGSYGMAGAAILACRAAVRSGAGLTRLLAPKSIYPILASSLTETVHTPIDETTVGTASVSALESLCSAAEKSTAFCIGCGLGRNRYTTDLLADFTKQLKCPLILDADGINAASHNIDIIEHISAPLILTPHVGEMARLNGCTNEEINADRIGYAVRTARRFNATVVLKGANTVIASGEKVYVNMNGNAGMATAGSGDVLAGIITAFAASGLNALNAAKAGVFVHGAAGDLAAEKMSQISLSASDIIDFLPEVFKTL